MNELKLLLIFELIVHILLNLSVLKAFSCSWNIIMNNAQFPYKFINFFKIFCG